MVGRDRDAVRDFVDDVQLLDADLIDFVEQVDARDIDAVPLDDVDQVVGRRVVPQRDVGVVHLVLGQNGLHGVQVELGLGDGGVEVDASLVLPPEVDVGRRFVQPDAEALQLVLQQLLVVQRLQDVQHHEDQVAGAGHGDDLPSATLAVLRALDDSGQVEQLDLRPLVLDAAGHGGERCEFVRGHLRVHAGQVRE